MPEYLFNDPEAVAKRSAEIPEPLQACIDKFWDDNPDMKRRVLKDWYARGNVSLETDEAGRAAVDRWLTLSNGDR